VSEYLINQIQKSIKDRRLIVVAGAGVSMNATDNADVASWKGLLKNGLRRCRDIQSTRRDIDKWFCSLDDLIEFGDQQDWLLVAENISSRLGAPDGHEFKLWLEDTVGSLKVKDRALVDALAALDVPIITTNYDHLFEEISGLDGLTLENHNEVAEAINQKKRCVIHVHGSWANPCNGTIFPTMRSGIEFDLVRRMRAGIGGSKYWLLNGVGGQQFSHCP
jgi:hypothetical protein